MYCYNDIIIFVLEPKNVGKLFQEEAETLKSDERKNNAPGILEQKVVEQKVNKN